MSDTDSSVHTAPPNGGAVCRSAAPAAPRRSAPLRSAYGACGGLSVKKIRVCCSLICSRTNELNTNKHTHVCICNLGDGWFCNTFLKLGFNKATGKYCTTRGVTHCRVTAGRSTRRTVALARRPSSGATRALPKPSTRWRALGWLGRRPATR